MIRAAPANGVAERFVLCGFSHRNLVTRRTSCLYETPAGKQMPKRLRGRLSGSVPTMFNAPATPTTNPVHCDARLEA